MNTFRVLFLFVVFLVVLQPDSGEAQSPESISETTTGSLRDECRQLKKETHRQLARCRTIFQLGEIKQQDMRRGWNQQLKSSTSIPEWVPQIADLARPGDLEERTLANFGVRERLWSRGRGGEYLGYAWFYEVIVHTLFIEALEKAGFEISDWTSVPSRQAHAVSAGGHNHTHIIVASQPETCRSLHLTLISHPNSKTYPYPPSPFAGRMTEIQVAFREP